MTRSTRAVVVALIVDFAIVCANAVAFMLTGSTAIMAELARRLLATNNLDATWSTLDGPQALERLLVGFGGQVTAAIGNEIDRIEAQLSKAAPEASHVDLEPD